MPSSKIFSKSNQVLPVDEARQKEHGESQYDNWYQRLEIRPTRILRVVSVNNHPSSRHTNQDIAVHATEECNNLDVTSVQSDYNDLNALNLVCRTATKNVPIESGDKNQYYDKVDIINNTLIFLIHGVGGSADVWNAQIQYFQKLGYGVVCPDLIGHGFSCAPRSKSPYEFKEICADLLELFDRFSREINVVIGHSYGGSFAAVIAHERPHLVQSMVLISGGSPTPLSPQPGIFSLPICLLCCCRSIIANTFYQKAFHNGKQFESCEVAFAIPSYVLKNTMNGQHWLAGGADYHAEILTRTLLIYGADDELVSMAEELEMKQVIKGAQLEVINHAGHMVIMEKPDEVNQHIAQFINTTR